MVTLCLDFGERYVGVAITDADGKIALRHSVVDQKQHEVFDAVAALVAREHITKILVGVPLSLSGEETGQTYVSLNFIEQLRDRLGSEVEIEGVDETLTSVEADRTIRHEGGDKNEAHAEAARLMLEDYLRS